MKIHIVGNPKPILGKNIYALSGQNIKEQRWKLLKNGRTILDLGTDGGITFNQTSLGEKYIIHVDYTDSQGIKGYDRLTVTPIAGKPQIQQIVWKDDYYNDIGEKKVGYADNVRLFIFTLNIPAGEILNVTIWEDEGSDGRANSSRNMETYTAKVDKFGKAEVYFNNLKVYMDRLNKKDIIDDSVHQFYAQIKYKNILNSIEDTTQLKVKNDLQKLIPPPKHNNAAVVDIPDKKKKPENKTGVKITVNVFFDGTKNNAKNTEARLLYLKKQKGIPLTDKENEKAIAYKLHTEDESSYENFYSNVAIMHQLNLVDNSKKEIKVYIEGEGTENLVNDDTMGYAFGSGVTGIRSKVTKAFKVIKNNIDGLREKGIIKNTEFVNEIDLNVFGFSRGAAAARHFVSRRRELQNIFTHVESKKFNINLMGLFDTVSSYEEEGNYGKYGSALSHDFDNDVEELKLKLSNDVAKVIHLTAADEYREYFSLTNIKSSIEAGIGFELQLPGAHSDVGGGYCEIENEVRYLDLETKYDNIKESVLKEGWYLPSQIFTPEWDRTTLRATRNRIPNSYQFIPLAIMIQLAEKYSLQFDKSLMETKGLAYNIPEDLEYAKKSLIQYALENDKAISEKVTIRPEYLHPIRNKYLHRSTCHDTGKTGRYKNGKPYRKHHNG